MRPRDVFVEQSVARLASVASFAGGDTGVADEGLGAVVATPIMRWLHDLDGPVDQFNQTVVLQAPAGVGQTDVETVLQALLDLEADRGRQRPYRYAPRTLDLDLILYGQRVINTERLTVPHPRALERAFVLQPLLDSTVMEERRSLPPR